MAKRISLREFQEGVVARLKSIGGGEAAPSKLGIQVGAGHWLVDLTDVSEVAPVPPIAGVPLTHSWFKGVSNVRGNLFSIVDLPSYLGEEPVRLNLSSRLLLIHHRHIVNSALLVNRMLGLRNIESMQLTTEPDADRPWIGAGYKDESGRDWRELNVPLLVQQLQFLQVGTV
ncbi:chemotaxis protein CheW [Parachitinimonas caeni]|uniref:Chemotaxis protein CheW n=1 Tax=Parachitinimonas caeni TaxID=3031301 RepID=A0ABT7DQX7_9NEIS|nr:chemotaxis protein CheW [Parachitinimonas caeni]MDK2122480.1 chemotaxis protein CheW [Parachitinimonas caeni]